MRLRDAGTLRLSWRDVWVICRFAPVGSPLAQAMDPELAWTQQEHLTAGLLDLARFSFWRESDVKGRGPKPEPLARPGQTAPVNVHTTQVDSMSLEEAEEWMASRIGG